MALLVPGVPTSCGSIVIPPTCCGEASVVVCGLLPAEDPALEEAEAREPNAPRKSYGVGERTDGAIIIGFEKSSSRYILRNSLESVPPFVSESYDEGKKDCREGCWGGV
jgi:hypothetical protein